MEPEEWLQGYIHESIVGLFHKLGPSYLYLCKMKCLFRLSFLPDKQITVISCTSLSLAHMETFFSLSPGALASKVNPLHCLVPENVAQ
jgi:hypothetical protein